jgi:asparagine synthase (glutamine-hydrolysing)
VVGPTKKKEERIVSIENLLIEYMSKITAFRTLLEEAIANIISKTPPETRCIILSGGVDTCAILAAAPPGTFKAAFTVCLEGCADEAFAKAAAKEHSIPHHIISLTADDLIQTYLPHCVQLLKSFDGMTIRNSLVIAASFQKASKMGFTSAIVGDGADELLGGYSFTWGHEDNPALWKEKRDKMCQEWTFATEALARSYKLTSHGPYMDPKLVDWVLGNVHREDCIGTRPIRLVYQGECVDHITGKLLLRESYETVASWRRKDPIEVGSGATVIGKDSFWKDRVSDEEFQSEVEALMARGFRIPTKEYLINFRAFEQVFGPQGQHLPNGKRLGLNEGCAGCCFEIGKAAFCHICGCYPAQRNMQNEVKTDSRVAWAQH